MTDVLARYPFLIPLSEALEADERIQAAYLLGSAASGSMRPDSDIDIALLPRAGVKFDAMDRSELASRLSITAGRDVDIGILSTRNLVYAREALLKGTLLFTKDERKTEERASVFLGMYVVFNELRKEVTDAYRT